MNNSIIFNKFIKSISVASLLTLMVIVQPLQAIAAPRTTPFSVGQTLDPGAELIEPCGPTDANCYPSINTASTTAAFASTTINSFFQVLGSTTLSTTTINNLMASNSTSTNLFSSNASVTNATATNLFASILNALSAFISNLIFNNATGTNLYVANLTATNTLTVGGQVLSSTTIANINSIATTTGTSTFNIINSTSSNITNLNATNSTTTGSFVVTGTSSLSTTTITNLTAGNSTTTNSTSTNSYTTNLTANNASITNSTSTNSNITNLVARNSTSTNLFSSNASITNATTTSFFSSLLNALTAVITNLFATNANITTLSASTTNASTTNTGALTASATSTFNGMVILNSAVQDGSGATGTAGQILSTTGTSTRWIDVVTGSSTGTSTFNILNSTSSNITNLNANNSTTTGNMVVTGTSSLSTTTITNLVAGNSTTTNSTSTNLFSSLLSALTAIISNLTATNATTTNATTTGLQVVTGTTTLSTTTIANLTSGNTTITGTFNAATSTLATTTLAQLTVLGHTYLGTVASGTASDTIVLVRDQVTGLIKQVSLSAITSTTSGAISFATTTGLLTYNLNGVPSTTTLDNFANLSIGNSNITNATITNSTSTNSFATFFNALTSAFTNIFANNATLTNATSTNLVATNANLYNTILATTTLNGPISGSNIITDITLASSSYTNLASAQAVKAYIDSKVNGLSWRAAIDVISTTTDPATTVVGQTSAIVDGYTLVNGNRVLFTSVIVGTTTYLDKVFLVGGVGSAITLTLETDGLNGNGTATTSDTLYINTGSMFGNKTYTYNGTAWVLTSSLNGALLSINNLSDIGNATTARANLSLGSGNNVTFNSITALNATSNLGSTLISTSSISFLNVLTNLWASVLTALNLNATNATITNATSTNTFTSNSNVTNLISASTNAGSLLAATSTLGTTTISILTSGNTIITGTFNAATSTLGSTTISRLSTTGNLYLGTVATGTASDTIILVRDQSTGEIKQTTLAAVTSSTTGAISFATTTGVLTYALNGIPSTTTLDNFANLTIGTSTITNGIITNLLSTNSTNTNSTSTNLFATLLNALTAIFTNLISINATITNSTSTNSYSSSLTSLTTNAGQLVAGTSSLATTTVTLLTVSSNANVNGNLTVLSTTTLATTTIAALRDSLGNLGTAGQYLQTTGTSTKWTNIAAASSATGSIGIVQITDGNGNLLAASNVSYSTTTGSFTITGTTTLATTTIAYANLTNGIANLSDATITRSTSTNLYTSNLSAGTTTLGTTTISTSSISNLNVLTSLWAAIGNFLGLAATNATLTNATTTNFVTSVVNASTSLVTSGTASVNLGASSTYSQIGGAAQTVTVGGSLTQLFNSTDIREISSTTQSNIPSNGATFADGKYLYVFDSASKLHTIDVSIQNAPIYLASTTHNSFGINDGVMVGKIIYGKSSFGSANNVIAMDISNPASPRQISTGSFDAGVTGAGQIAARGQYVISGTASSSINIFDMTTGTRVASSSFPGTVSTTNHITWNGNYVYVVNVGTSNIHVFNVTNINNPVLVNTVSIGFAPSFVLIANNRLIMTVGSGQVPIFDISNPALPVLLSTGGVSGLTPFADAFSHGRYIIGFAANGALRMLDAARPESSPTLIASVLYTSALTSGAVAGRYAYVFEGANQLHIVDLGGIDATSLTAGIARVGELTVNGGANVLGSLSSESLTTGNGGVQSLGAFTSLATNTASYLSNALVLASATAATTTNAIYNQGGTLYFNGAQVGAGMSPFTLQSNGTITAASTTAQLAIFANTQNATQNYSNLVIGNDGVLRKAPTINILSDVIDNFLATPPGSPNIGDSYLLATTTTPLTGAWVTATNSIATWNGSSWAFYVPATNDRTTVLTGVNAGSIYVFSGSTWSTQTAITTDTWKLGGNTSTSTLTFGNLLNGAINFVASNTSRLFVSGTTTAGIGIGTSTNIYGGDLSAGLTLGYLTNLGTRIANVLTLSSATSTTNISTSTNALYNVNGSLYWNGATVGGSSLPASSTSLYVSLDGKVGVGTSTASSTLHIAARSGRGSGTVTSVGAAVTGVGTSFTTQVVAGDIIQVGTYTATVASVGSATTLTLSSGFAQDIIVATNFSINNGTNMARFTSVGGTDSLIVTSNQGLILQGDYSTAVLDTTTILANGDFSTNSFTSWTAGAGWAAGTGAAVYTPTNAAIAGASFVRITNGGTGYSVSDVLTLSAGSGDAQITVTSVSVGKITAFTLSNAGTSYNDSMTGSATGGSGSGFTYAITRVVTGNTLTQTSSPVLVAGQSYQLTFSKSGSTQGSVSISVGGVAPVSSNKLINSTFTYTFQAASAAILTITPTSDFNGTLDNFVLTRYENVVSPLITLNNTSGVASLEIRTSGITDTFVGLSAGKRTTSATNVSAFGVNALSSNTTGSNNNAFGSNALTANTTSGFNNAFGSSALTANTTGASNNAFGHQALSANTSGASNNAFGGNSLRDNTTGSFNTAFGETALLSNTTASGNSSFGANSLTANTTGGSNNAFGNSALTANTIGGSNSAFGNSVLTANTIGGFNNGFGNNALNRNTSGTSNNAFGTNALQANTIGTNNSAFGLNALLSSVTGSGNVAIGYSALSTNVSATSTTAVGYNAGLGTIGSYNQGGTYLGYQAGFGTATSSDYNTFLGHQAGYGITTGTNNIILGTATSSTGINNLTTGNQNILIGNNIGLASSTGNGQLNIANYLFGNGLTGTGQTISNGGLGIGTTTNIYGGALTAGLTLNNALVLASSTALSTTTLALYNNNGTLYWNGSAVGGGSGIISSSTSLYQAANGGMAIGTTTNIYGGALTQGLTLGQTTSGGQSTSNVLVLASATSTSLVSTSTNALYNVNNTLYWNGADIITRNTGITAWTDRNGTSAKNWQSVTYGNSLFVAVNSNTSATAAVMTSTDGTTWTDRNVTSAKSWTSVTYGNSLFVAVNQTGLATAAVMTSPDGITWTDRNVTSAKSWQSITYGNGLFVAVNNDNLATAAVMTSPDGITWTDRNVTSAKQWSSVTYGNGLFVAVNSAGSATAAVMTSPDGITWTDRNVTSAKLWREVTYGNGLFVAVNNSGSATAAVMTSSDGITWTDKNINSVKSWQSVTYGNGLFVAVNGDNVATGAVMTSSILTNGLSDIAQDGNSIGRTLTLGTTDSNALSFITNSTERMKIFSGGAVSIGTTSSPGFFTVMGTSTSNIAFFGASGGTGCALTAGGALNCSSDIAFKKNISTTTYGLDSILSLDPKMFNWNFEDDNATKTLGFIAQDVESILPELVSADSNGKLALNQSGMIPILVNAIKDLNNKIFSYSLATEMDIEELTASTTISVDTKLKRLGTNVSEINQILADLASSTSPTSTTKTKEIVTMTTEIVTDEFGATSTRTTYATTTEVKEVETFIGRLISRVVAEVKSFFAKEIETEKICLGTNENRTCMTKEQLEALLAQANLNAASSSEVQSANTITISEQELTGSTTTKRLDVSIESTATLPISTTTIVLPELEEIVLPSEKDIVRYTDPVQVEVTNVETSI